LTFAKAVEQIKGGDRSHSLMPVDRRNMIAAERLHPQLASSRIRALG
jgi:hypothetical protein